MRQAILRFVVLLFPLLTLTVLVAWYVYNEDIQQLESRIRENEQNFHLSTVKLTELHFAPVIDDLRYLTEKVTEVVSSEQLTTEQVQTLSDTFIRMANTRPYYDQIRLIDDHGLEQVRVDITDGIPSLAAAGELQDKGQRPYVQESLSVPPGSVYISQFDLNTEHGQIETPMIPTLRFISHFKLGNKSWLVVLNYLGDNYLNQIKNHHNWNHNENWLVNNRGEWLIGPNQESSWQFMFPDQEKTVPEFSEVYPELWQAIASHPNGQVTQGDYLYTYTHNFSELRTTNLSFTGPIHGADLPWTIISRVNLTAGTWALTMSREGIVKLLLFSFLSMCLLAGSILLARHYYRMLRDEKQLKLEIEDTVLKYKTVLRNVPDGLVSVSQDLIINTINKSAGAILNIQPHKAVGKPLLSLIHGHKNREAISRLVVQAHENQANPSPKQVKARLKFNDLRDRHIECTATETTYSTSSELLLNFRDVTYWINREEKLKSMSRALEQSNDSIVITNHRGIIEYVNRAFEKFTGIKSKDILGSQSTSLLKRTLGEDANVRELQAQLKEGQTVRRVVTRTQADDSVLYEEKTISPIRNSRGRISHYISTGKDITERVLFESKLHKLAHYDLLTELPNRMMLQQLLEQTVQDSRSTGSRFALMTMDLDHFKQVNDSLGHDVGDKVLLAVAQRIQHTLRAGDILARLDGDEFAIVVKHGVEPDNLVSMANRLIRRTNEPLCIDSKELFISASMGGSLFPDDCDDVDTLFKNADIALYRAKDGSRNQFCFFTPQMGAESIKMMRLESELRKTIGTEQYELYYQPKVNTATRQICGIEALLRWKDAEGRIQPPYEIIPILEHSGMIIEVGEHQIMAACRQLKQWQQQQYPLNFALNISARQLLNSNLVETVRQAIEETGCDPRHLELEITESVIMTDVTTALDKLRQLEGLGVKIAIDDFGTGYSSLAYLSRFPVHILKVDREFVKDLPWNKDNITITRSIVELAHNLGMSVVAEGVETMAQAQFLASLGVEEFQGFYFGHPVPIAEFVRLYLHAPHPLHVTEKAF
ncbi:bifunctional diguanylate cyclase/phosphodiesterase [Photobacterium sp. TY1-4]|uniref:sensor domain-containing protein n=1 Tax=Photobacterium sp. TY1-4 TaxID=2899122 RepID=UPI0021BF2A40|nr:bifunctional diguanylate cyclase/phosphodiesterase [Photobacterium sp. TY1-4]UXI02487.1 EAL domain-containing protein [Photobacterium sp. TY1-4]